MYNVASDTSPLYKIWKQADHYLWRYWFWRFGGYECRLAANAGEYFDSNVPQGGIYPHIKLERDALNIFLVRVLTSSGSMGGGGGGGDAKTIISPNTSFADIISYCIGSSFKLFICHWLAINRTWPDNYTYNPAPPVRPAHIHKHTYTHRTYLLPWYRRLGLPPSLRRWQRRLWQLKSSAAAKLNLTSCDVLSSSSVYSRHQVTWDAPSSRHLNMCVCLALLLRFIILNWSCDFKHRFRISKTLYIVSKQWICTRKICKLFEN